MSECPVDGCDEQMLSTCDHTGCGRRYVALIMLDTDDGPTEVQVCEEHLWS